MHTVADDTGLKQYLPAVRGFLDFVEEHNLPHDDVDCAMLQYLGKCCYYDEKGVQHGNLVVNGFCYLFPEQARELPHSWRALRGWLHFAVLREGQPIGVCTLACMSDELDKAAGTFETPECQAAECIRVAVDGYLREQDLFQLQVDDVVFHDEQRKAVLLLGVSKRGESCKSGRDQGVVLDETANYDILKRRIGGRKKGRVWSLTADRYRKLWQWAAESVTGSKFGAGTPHAARHTGASRDLTEGHRNLEEVMKRGRWKAINSVHRYAKPHAWYAALACESAEIQFEELHF